MLKFLLKYEIVHNKVYNTVSVRSLMPIIQHTLYNAISQKPLQEAGGGRKILELFLPIWRQFENNFCCNLMTTGLALTSSYYSIVTEPNSTLPLPILVALDAPIDIIMP